MNTTFLKQLWLASRIWLLAVVMNTILGTVYLAGINFLDVGSLLFIGIYYGAIFSLPVMIAILIMINRYSVANKSGLLLFRDVLRIGIALTVVVFMAFWIMMSLRGVGMCLVLLSIAILSGILGMTTFNRSIVKWGRIRQ